MKQWSSSSHVTPLAWWEGVLSTCFVHCSEIVCPFFEAEMYEQAGGERFCPL